MILLLNYKVSFQQFNIAQLHVQHFQFEDKFVVGLGQVGLVRLSDVPLHASTAQLGATSSPFLLKPTFHGVPVDRWISLSMLALLATLIIGHEYWLLSLAQATHLANLIPLTASTIRPSVPGIRGFLERSCLPDEVIAFAACILDGLSCRFVATWRETLLPSNYARDLQYFMEIDTCHRVFVSPDVVVLAALSLAHGFFSDTRRSAHYWAVGMSRNQFTVPELEATKRSILHDMDYGLCRITEGMMESMLRDMQQTKPASLASECGTIRAGRRRNFSIDLSGTAIWKNGVQTPEPSP
jgi:hypothetical protein